MFGKRYSLEKKVAKPVDVPWRNPVRNPIRKCPGFEKKELAIYKLDAMAFCQFGCVYCSSNCGNLMRINTAAIKRWTKKIVGVPLNSRTDAEKFFMSYPGIVESLEEQLLSYPKLTKVEGVLQFGMLVDNFSPFLVGNGITLQILMLLLEKTKFIIRILSKSAAVARNEFIELFQRYPGRVTVGSSCGTLNADEIRHVELFTSSPSARAKAIRSLQETGIRTFLMACPILPGFADKNEIEELYSAFNPPRLESAWCEPYNDRANWKSLLDAYKNYEKRAELFKIMSDKREWASYALSLAQTHADTLKKQGFKGNSIFLLYQDGMTAREIEIAKKIPSVSFQSGALK